MAAVSRDEHYKRMNDYRDSREYQEYANAIYETGWSLNNLPSLFEQKWEITEELYWEFIEMLPPIYCKGGFMMCEMTFDNITNKFTKEGNKYYCSWSRTDTNV